MVHIAHIHTTLILYFLKGCFRNVLTVATKDTKDFVGTGGARQDTGYSTESSDSRRSRMKKVKGCIIMKISIFFAWSIFNLKNPFLSIATKSYSTSTGGEPRELDDLCELPTEYIELREYTDSESDYRYA